MHPTVEKLSVGVQGYWWRVMGNVMPLLVVDESVGGKPLARHDALIVVNL